MLDNVDITLEHAISAHEAGNLVLAGEKYLEVLNLDPNHPDANHILDLLLLKWMNKLWPFSSLRMRSSLTKHKGILGKLYKYLN